VCGRDPPRLSSSVLSELNSGARERLIGGNTLSLRSGNRVQGEMLLAK